MFFSTPLRRVPFEIVNKFWISTHGLTNKLFSSGFVRRNDTFCWYIYSIWKNRSTLHNGGGGFHIGQHLKLAPLGFYRSIFQIVKLESHECFVIPRRLINFSLFRFNRFFIGKFWIFNWLTNKLFLSSFVRRNDTFCWYIYSIWKNRSTLHNGGGGFHIGQHLNFAPFALLKTR